MRHFWFNCQIFVSFLVIYYNLWYYLPNKTFKEYTSELRYKVIYISNSYKEPTRIYSPISTLCHWWCAKISHSLSNAVTLKRIIFSASHHIWWLRFSGAAPPSSRCASTRCPCGLRLGKPHFHHQRNPFSAHNIKYRNALSDSVCLSVWILNATFMGCLRHREDARTRDAHIKGKCCFFMAKLYRARALYHTFCNVKFKIGPQTRLAIDYICMVLHHQCALWFDIPVKGWGVWLVFGVDARFASILWNSTLVGGMFTTATKSSGVCRVM